MDEIRVSIDDCTLIEVDGKAVYIYNGEEYYPYEVSPFGMVRLVSKDNWNLKLRSAYEDLNKRLGVKL